MLRRWCRFGFGFPLSLCCGLGGRCLGSWLGKGGSGFRFLGVAVEGVVVCHSASPTSCCARCFLVFVDFALVDPLQGCRNTGPFLFPFLPFSSFFSFFLL